MLIIDNAKDIRSRSSVLYVRDFDNELLVCRRESRGRV
jgi:hypothetical protein